MAEIGARGGLQSSPSGEEGLALSGEEGVVVLGCLLSGRREVVRCHTQPAAPLYSTYGESRACIYIYIYIFKNI